MWDEHERALVDAYLDWKADLHSCGRPMSEALRVEGRDDPDYVVGTQICLACRELDAFRARRAKHDKKAHDDGRNPDAYRLDVIYTAEEAAELAAAVDLAARTAPTPDDDD